MKAQDLRIGNYISLELAEEGTPYECIVVGVEQDRIYYLPWLKMKPKAYFLYSFYCYVNPIPLTEEWLLKLGFKLDDSYGWTTDFITGFYMFELAELSEKGYELRVNNEYNTGCKIKFVHQLQNLYFALTGKELKIT